MGLQSIERAYYAQFFSSSRVPVCQGVHQGQLTTVTFINTYSKIPEIFIGLLSLKSEA